MPPKAILLIDNCSAHKPIELLQTDDGNILAMLLPPNVTAVIQPMDQNPIKLVKLAYRTKLLCNIVAQDEFPVEVLLKAHNIRDAIVMLKKAWDELPRTVLQSAWKRIKNWDDKEYEMEDDVPLAELAASHEIYGDSIREIQSLLSKIGLDANLTLNDIEEWNEDLIENEEELNEIEDDKESDVEIVEEIEKVQYTDAIHSVNTLIKWCENNNETSEMSDLINFRAKIVQKYLAKPKTQASLTDFFKPMETD